MKGIADVIAALILLLIAISLTVAGYYFITNIMTGQMQGIEVRDAFCSGTTVTMYVKNLGTNNVTSITCTQTSPTGDTCVFTLTNYPIGSGETKSFTETCTGSGQRVCSYRLLADTGGNAVTPSTTCT